MAATGSRHRAQHAASAAVRRRVVEGAARCFGEHGYDAVSIEMIRTAAAVSVGSLYHHFDGKAGVAAAVYAEAIARYHAALLAVLDQQLDAETGVRELIAAHHRWVTDDEVWARFMMASGDLVEIRAAAADHAAANERLVTSLMSWAQPLMDRGDLATLEPPVFVAALFGPSYFHTRAALRHQPGTPSSSAAPALATAAWRSVRSDVVHSPYTTPTDQGAAEDGEENNDANRLR